MKVIGNAAAQVCGRRLNNRAENSHQPFRRRETAMAKFRDMKTLQKFAPVHASIHHHFNQDRHLDRRDIFKQNRSAALVEWRQLAAWPPQTSTLRMPVQVCLTNPSRLPAPPVIPNCVEQDSSQFVKRSNATQAFLASAHGRAVALANLQ